MGALLDLVLARWAFFAAAMTLFGSRLFPLYASQKRGGVESVDRWRAMALSFIALLAATGWLFALAHDLDDKIPI